MSEINILSPHVADLIAAGEVVERPASVIKELIENSFDAGAQSITIELKSGGLTYIRVTDDGSGMLPEDAGLCFLRHATSKLRDERGLECIGTMGFRGEALAAISSVSRIELITRKKGTDVGTRVVLEAGEIIEMVPHGCPEGTTMIVRDLFFNTPARLKFMKSDRTEASSCMSAALRCALGRPDVSVRLIKDGDEQFFSPGDGKASSCIYSLLGRETALEFLDCKSVNEGISVAGFVGSPKAAHGNRAKQFFFCNGRNIKSQLLQAAVEQAYKNTLLTGRYPSCVIYLNLSSAAVDVNVHPAKIEVKFREERQVFDTVYYAALSAIEGERSSAEIKLSPSTKAVTAPKKDFYQTMSTVEFREKYSDTPKTENKAFSSPKADMFEKAPPKPSAPTNNNTIYWDRTAASEGTKVRESETPYILSRKPGNQAQIAPEKANHEVQLPKQEALLPEKDVSMPPEDSLLPKLEEPNRTATDIITEVYDDFRLIGEAMKTYIIVEKNNELYLIDKHAAHERMLFDKLKKQGHEIMSQSLLIPVTVKLSSEETELIEKHSVMLSALGFEIEPYGEDCVILRGVPSETDALDAASMVEEICEKLKKCSTLSASEATDEILHTVACKAAIKAGWNTTEDELLIIAEEVMSGKVKYCPHGRPVSMTLSKKQLDKEFSRIV